MDCSASSTARVRKAARARQEGDWDVVAEVRLPRLPRVIDIQLPSAILTDLQELALPEIPDLADVRRRVQQTADAVHGQASAIRDRAGAIVALMREATGV